ncbi:MAG: aminopeptidase P family protein [Candidatus Aminicenantes bacterium]|nr:aminopeptidase P family protein [Candidatus Aminicenantes bacterium]
MFKTTTYIKRRKRLHSQIDSGLLLFLGNDESPMNYADNPFHYRQDSTFLYFFGLNFAGLAGVIDIDTGKDILFGNDLTVEDIVWMGTQPSLAERCQKVGIQYVQPLEKLRAYLMEAEQKGRKIHYLPPYRAEHTMKLYDLLGTIPSKAVQSASIEFITAVVEQRNTKSGEEIAEIERAVDITADMHITAIKMARPGITEARIAAAVHEVALAAGGNLAFPIIATIHGETLHNHYHGNVLRSGDMFLLDAGAETAMGYGGDLSSTMPVDSQFTDRQREIYKIALDSHNAAIAKLNPGIPFRDVHFSACRTLAAGLKDMGFMRGDVDEAVAAGAHALFFPCGTGHMMGLDIHDMENLGEKYVGYAGKEKSTQFGLKSLRLARELEPGFVFTIEPGIYFIPELIDMWRAEGKHTEFIDYNKVESYKNFGGLRNEENFVITENGCRLLGKPIPKTIEDVEAMTP